MARTYNQKLTRLYKSLIKKKQLIDTGTLLASIKVYVVNTSRKITIVVVGIDYHKYLKDPFNLVNEFQESSVFQDVINEYYTARMEKAMENIINPNEEFDASILDLNVDIEFKYF